MTSQYPNGVQIDRVTNDAICTEVGKGLRAMLTESQNQLPQHLLRLQERFDSVEYGYADFKKPLK